jgi:hypothetical protein
VRVVYAHAACVATCALLHRLLLVVLLVLVLLLLLLLRRPAAQPSWHGLLGCCASTAALTGAASATRAACGAVEMATTQLTP